MDAEQRHGATLQLMAWDELSGDVRGQLRRLAERVG
jgi:hypothetical protein